MSHIYDNVLYDYQKNAVDKMVDRRITLLADQPGLGKTLEVLSTLEELNQFEHGTSLILTPIVAAQTAWKDSIDKFVLPNHPELQLLDLSKGSSAKKLSMLQDHDFSRPTIVLANHGAIEWGQKARIPSIHSVQFTSISIDESHLVLPINSDRTLTQFWRGLKNFSTIPIRIAISGTPDRGKLENRFGTYKFLKPGKLGAVRRWDWLDHYFHTYEKRVARNRTIKAIGSIKSNVAWNNEEDSVIVRRTKNEVLSQLPPKQYRFIELDIYKEQRKEYLDAVQVMTEQKIEAEEQDRDSAAAMIFALRGRQISTCQWENNKPVVGGKSAKLDWILEWMSERGYGNPDIESGQVVIASQFVRVLYWLQAELKSAGLVSEVLEGSLTGERRAQIQRNFQAGELQIVLLSGRMGVGINLDAADDLILLDLPYDPDMLEQIEDRIHRASNMHQVTIWTLISAGTIEQIIAETIAKRYRATRLTMDGRRGVDFERKVLSKIRIKMSDPTDRIENLEGDDDGNN
jgi:SNF2 family DNA or RNA helicase|tara:strand:+ start:332 stop:1879 length:1548 start_codon:yes stop_codon:yes gene_type:complete